MLGRGQNTFSVDMQIWAQMLRVLTMMPLMELFELFWTVTWTCRASPYRTAFAPSSQ